MFRCKAFGSKGAPFSVCNPLDFEPRTERRALCKTASELCALVIVLVGILH